MHSKKSFRRSPLFAAGALAACVSSAFAVSATPAAPVEEPAVSAAPAPQPPSTIALNPLVRADYGLQATNVTVRATNPRELSAVPAASAPIPAAVSASAPAPASAPASDGGLSAADRELLARLDAELSATEKKLDRANAALSSGQKQLVRVASLLQSEMLQGGPDARGLHPFVRVAERYAGTPYVWGGESARGFDCSGFIIRVMRDLGYKALPHSAAEQFRYGIPVAKANLQPGDLVFFANTYKPGISHVGIYLGRGRFIHAAGTGLGTIVSSLNSGTYRAKYAGARRLVRVRA